MVRKNKVWYHASALDLIMSKEGMMIVWSKIVVLSHTVNVPTLVAVKLHNYRDSVCNYLYTFEIKLEGLTCRWVLQLMLITLTKGTH